MNTAQRVEKIREVLTARLAPVELSSATTARRTRVTPAHARADTFR